MQPGRVGLSAQLIISLMRHRECVMKAIWKSFLACVMGIVVASGCAATVRASITANAAEQDDTTASVIGTYWKIPDFCPGCGAENSQFNFTWTYFEDKDGCTYTYRHAVRSGNYCTGKVTVHNGKEFYVEATCTENGAQGVYCADCGAVGEVTEIPATGHNWSDWIDTRSSCAEAGQRSRICLTCGAVEIENVTAGTHTFGEAVTITAATCTEDGQGEAFCIYCGQKETFAIEAIGHHEISIPGVDPTCTETGLTEGIRCSICGIDLVEQETIPALGHDYNMAFHVYPDETMPGEEIYQCAHCGDVYGRAIAPEVQEENNELWIPIVIIVEGAVILLSVVTGIVLVCIKKRGANKCNGGKSS